MTLNPLALLDYRFANITQCYVERDTILYALGVGLGADPLDPIDLRFLLENGNSVLPTMAVTLGSPGLWVADPSLGIDVTRLVHSAQSATFHAPLPSSGTIVARARIASLTDRGKDKGAVVIVERQIQDAGNGQDYCTLQQTLLLRGNGGFGGEPTPREPAFSIPDRAADYQIYVHVPLRAALIYRLSGDWNPLHADPAVARKAGFERPIFHGLGSYGIAGWNLLRLCADGDPERLRNLSVRFSGVIFPGDTLHLSIWQDDEDCQFEGWVGSRKVLDRGRATIRPA